MRDKKRSIIRRKRTDCLLFLPVHFFRFIPLVVVLLIVSQELSAQDQPAKRRGSQILDDTTKQVYGPKTSRYYFEKDVFLNRQTYYFIDTVIRDFHNFSYVQRNQNVYQDLGNIGTSLRPIFYQTPEVIGVSSGFQSYDIYWDSEQIKYYDTKSPYSNMKVVLGGKGRSITKASFSRNINPRWNFGFNYRGLLIDKQVQRQSKGDRNVRSTYYDLYTAYQTKDSSYRAFVNFRRNHHEADEYGGIRKLNDDYEYKDYFKENAQPSLQEASSTDFRMQFHLYHQYEIGRALQLYHTFDRYRQGTGFNDLPELEIEGYYDYVEVENDTTNDDTKFKTVRNEVGIKGNLSKLFYNGYYAIRNFSMTNKYLSPDTLKVGTSGVESYLGGRISLVLDSIGEITGWGELQESGNYRIEGSIKSRWFEATLRQMQYATPFLLQAYRGSHDVWNNDFSDVNVTQLNGYLHYTSRVFSISPGLTFTRLGNYVYFKEQDVEENQQSVLPVQSSGGQVIFSPELKFSLKMLKHITLKSQTIYTKALENTGDAFQLPDLFLNAQLSYDNIFFNGNLDMHGGFEFHYKSAYYPLAYDVPIQQFYVQRTFKVPSFPLIDIFFDARIKRGRIFIKYNNIVQLITKEGYMLTPEYPGLRNMFDFGFDWSFYD